MAGINHLYDVYNKKGKQFIDNLFDSFVTVNEKMDGSSFNFERDRETGKFKFFKRNQNEPITLVDRTISKYYEKPIQYIESLPPHIIEKIPRGWRFGMEYFSNTKPVEIAYDHLPKNNLILSYVHKKDQNGKIAETIQSKEELDSWADLIGIERPPIVFQGKLDNDQKSKILDFLNTPFKELVEKYKTNSFVSFIIGVLNPDLEKTALNNDTEKSIEGIVFRFGDPGKEEEPVLAKMVDPVFTQLAKDKASTRASQKPSDFLGVTILDVMNFVLENGIDSFESEGDTEDKRYVSFISDVFVRFIDQHGSKYKGTDFEEPSYLKKDEFRLNRDILDDERVKSLLDEDDAYEPLFKLILNSFRKIRKRPSGIISGDVIEQFNMVVRDINKYIERKEKKGVNESEIPSFSGFRESNFSQKIEYVTEEDQEEDPFYSFNDFIETLESIDQSSPNKYQDELPEDSKKVNLIVGRFQPFHKGHLKMAKFLHEKNGLPCHIAVVYPGHNKSGKSPFTKSIIEKYMNPVVESNDEIEGYTIYKSGYLGNILSSLAEIGYDVSLLGCGDDRLADYTKQTEYLKNTDLSDLIGKHFEIVKTPRIGSATEVRDLLMNSDYSGFKKKTTPEVASVYNILEPAMRSGGLYKNESYSLENIAKNGILNETVEQMQDIVSFLEDPSKKTESIRKKQIAKMKKIIKDFQTFSSGMSDNKVSESDGFGTLPFLMKKESDVYHYFFNVTDDDGKERGFHLNVGKYSEYEPIDGPKNSYCVLNINEVSPTIIEDISMDIGEVPQDMNKEEIKLGDGEKSRVFESIAKCLLDYLELNPKVVRIYDELQDNIIMDNYIDYMKSIIISFLGNEWSAQEGSSKNLVLLLR